MHRKATKPVLLPEKNWPGYTSTESKQVELPAFSLLIKRALKGLERSHVAAGTPKIVRRPISWDVLLGGKGLASSWGPSGRVLWIFLALGYLFVTRLNEIFASATGMVHPDDFLTRIDVALYRGGQRLASLQWHQATNIEVRFLGHKGDQANRGRLSCAHATVPGGEVPGWETAAVPSLSWRSCCRVTRHCRKTPPCRRIGMVTRLECGAIRRPSRHFAR